MSGRVRVYIAASLDGFIAGPDDDLGWLTGPEAANPGGPTDPAALTFDGFIADVGAVLMGRGTFDVVRGMDWWGYGDRPVLVATHRELGAGVRPSVQRVDGSIDTLVAQAKEAARGKDVYIDGGNLIRQAVDADLIDDITITIAPIALGAGHPLFAGIRHPYPLDVVSHHTFQGGMVQLRAKPRRRAPILSEMSDSPQAHDTMMHTNETAEIIRRFNQAFAEHNPAMLDDIVGEDCVMETIQPAPDGTRYVGHDVNLAFWRAMAADRATRFEVEDTVVMDDRAHIRWRFHFGDGMSVRGVTLVRVRDGRIVEALAYSKSPGHQTPLPE